MSPTSVVGELEAGARMVGVEVGQGDVGAPVVQGGWRVGSTQRPGELSSRPHGQQLCPTWHHQALEPAEGADVSSPSPVTQPWPGSQP